MFLSGFPNILVSYRSIYQMFINRSPPNHHVAMTYNSAPTKKRNVQTNTMGQMEIHQLSSRFVIVVFL